MSDQSEPFSWTGSAGDEIKKLRKKVEQLEAIRQSARNVIEFLDGKFGNFDIESLNERIADLREKVDA